ncbi:short-chain dehydrogenase/reductase SDR [Nitrosococcus halophilus Nc 4]|uniref:Short-chain dehydrogenase/reductase SDR n=1 Tax=Nitrosococcus halophilus (strain Nc4) TaxID=472759 RepID=D5C398_NITHN|nr:glucose 1-dehydrogenase [Nitrosococcus halophilus]ADE16805.1 short-chain dehydrogenase/reductase SDR [Nitrosococcus halophilus Nc 4]
MHKDLAGKRVLVTGASGGLGAAIAKAFGGQGCRVLVHYRTREQGADQTVRAIQQAGGTALQYPADLRSEKAIEKLVNFIVETWNGIDVLVNNAGVVLKASALDAGATYWDDSLNVNLRAPYLLSRQVANQMIKEGVEGVILNNSSIHATKSVPYFSAYAASKAGLEAMSRVMALEWAPYHIRVNCIAPGVVPVERTQETLRAQQDNWMPHIPAGRFGRPQDIAEMAVYLCSKAADWVTGQSFVVDGGMLARMDMPRRPQPPLPPLPDPIA